MPQARDEIGVKWAMAIRFRLDRQAQARRCTVGGHESSGANAKAACCNPHSRRVKKRTPAPAVRILNAGRTSMDAGGAGS